MNVTMKQLLEAGVHFGHQSRRWNPKMKPYIFTERNGIYIIDLKKTLKLLRDAMKFVKDAVSEGKTVLFVGTKKQAKDSVFEAAQTCNMYYVNNRWLGGCLTNFDTIRKSVARLMELERIIEDGTIENYTKKEQSMLVKEKESLEKNLSGVKKMTRLPDIVFVVDPHKEAIAIHEARKLKIPIVGIVDTNCNPDVIDWVIPGNDDAIRAVKLIAGKIAESVVEGLMTRQEMGDELQVDEMPMAAYETLEASLLAEEKYLGAEDAEDEAMPEVNEEEIAAQAEEDAPEA